LLQTRLKNDYNYSYNNKEYNQKNKKNDLSSSGVVIFVLAIVIIGAILVSYIGQFVQIAHLSYEISRLEDHMESIKAENYLLNIKLAEEKSMAKIEKIARNSLNMVEPDRVEIVLLENKVKQIDILPENKVEKVFFVKVFDDFMKRIGTVQAEEIER